MKSLPGPERTSKQEPDFGKCLINTINNPLLTCLHPHTSKLMMLILQPSDFVSYIYIHIKKIKKIHTFGGGGLRVQDAIEQVGIYQSQRFASQHMRIHVPFFCPQTCIWAKLANSARQLDAFNLPLILHWAKALFLIFQLDDCELSGKQCIWPKLLNLTLQKHPQHSKLQGVRLYSLQCQINGASHVFG